MSEPFIAKISKLLPPKEEEGGEEREGETEVKREFLKLEEIQTPSEGKIGEYIVTIVEVHKINVPWNPHYLVAVRVRKGDWQSPLFHVPCKDTKEFYEKIREELRRVRP